jgi:hypothetical protein
MTLISSARAVDEVVRRIAIVTPIALAKILATVIGGRAARS